MNFPRKKKTESQLNAERVALDRLQRFNPLRNLSPDTLRQAHEEFNAGRLTTAARLWDAIERTDDMIKTVAPKRKKAVSRHGFEVVEIDDSPEAKRHAEVLRFFYDNLIATRADDRNQRGGLPLLIRNMMDAEGKKYSVHEVVWTPIDGGLTAELVFTPLWYFENTTGRLRYLNGVTDLSGSELEPAEWVVHAGEGLMEACAVAYMFKHLPLQDWLLYSEKFGMPVPIGKSPDQPGSEGWEALEDAVAAIGACDGAVISQSGSIDFADPGSAQNLPYPALIERMDRAMAALWRGADLSTMSKGDGTGASVQGDETDMLEDDDALSITDTLNEQLDRFVIFYATGSRTPKAWMKVRTGINQDTEGDLSVDKALNEIGFTQPVDELERRYNRTGLAIKPPPAGGMPLANEAPQGLDRASESVLQTARTQFAQAVSADLQPVAARFSEILEIEDDDQMLDALAMFQQSELPAMAAALLAESAAGKTLENALGVSLLNGWANAAARQSESP